MRGPRRLAGRIAKKAFALFGLNVQRKSGTRTTMGQVLGHVASLGIKPHTVIDLGVGSGTFELYDAFPGSELLLVEPLAEFEDHLKNICREFRGQYVLAAASNKPGTVVVNVHDYRLASSMFREAEGAHGSRQGILKT